MLIDVWRSRTRDSLDQLTREVRSLRLRFGQTKADQEAHGEEITLPEGRHVRPMQLLSAWLVRGKISEGPCSAG